MKLGYYEDTHTHLRNIKVYHSLVLTFIEGNAIHEVYICLHHKNIKEDYFETNHMLIARFCHTIAVYGD